MTIAPQTFSQDLILPKLVAYFNSLSDAQRTIKPNDFPVFNVKVIRNGEGSLDLIVGNPDVAVPANLYAGEATFLWVGSRGAPATATTESFFELSKFINVAGSSATGDVNVRYSVGTFVGVAPLPPITLPTFGTDYVYRVTLIDDYGDGWNGNTVTFNIDGAEYSGSVVGDSSTSQEYVFTADNGTSVFIGFNGEGEFPEECLMNVKQYEAANYPNGPFVEIFESAGTPLSIGTLLDFNAPWEPIPGITTTFNQVITSPLAEPDSQFGSALKVSSDHTTMAVSQPYATVNGQPSAGRVFVYTANQGAPGWRTDNIIDITSPTPVESDMFGLNSIGMDATGSRLAIAGGDSVYVYDRDGAMYTLAHTIPAPVAESGFGDWLVQLSSSGTRLFVGSYGESNNGVNSVGALYIFEYDGSDWNQATRLTPPTGDLINTGYTGGRNAVSPNGRFAVIYADRFDETESGGNFVAMYEATPGQNDWVVRSLDSILQPLDGFFGRLMYAVTVDDQGKIFLSYGSNSSTKIVVLRWNTNFDGEWNTWYTVNPTPNVTHNGFATQENTDDTFVTVWNDDLQVQSLNIMQFMGNPTFNVVLSSGNYADNIAAASADTMNVVIAYTDTNAVITSTFEFE